MSRWKRIAFCLVAAVALLLPFHLSAQDPPEVQRKKADTHFENEQYTMAMPLYSGLLANNKEDPNLNYRYGVCVLYASSEKDKALPFLIKASKSPDVDADVWYYLGRAYQLNYQFDQAISAYGKFNALNAKKGEKLQVENEIAMCKTGRKLLKAITDISVLDKAELNEADFFRKYDLKAPGFTGQLLVKGPEWQSALDKKKNEHSIIYLAGEKNQLAFSSYGSDETNGKDIYIVNKLPNGQWGKPMNPGYPINTEYDEDYPFLHPNGKVLYFSSKGHNSMGGYDIFRSEYNEETGTWLKPVNLDFAINSPDDDIMFVTDFEETSAWFASNRSSPQGKMTVYHVMIQRKPVNMVLIAGTFHSTDGDPNLGAKITVKNAETNEPVGVFKSNDKTGAYFMNLPNNGNKYTFTVEHSGIATQTKDVFVPPQYNIRTISQSIGYLDVNHEDQLYINTDFESDTSMLDPQFLKDKAKLDINNNASEVIVMNNSSSNDQNTQQNSANNDQTNEDDSDLVANSDQQTQDNSQITNADLVKVAMDDAQETHQEAIDLQNQANRAWQYANDLNSQAKDKQKEADAAKQAAGALPEGPEKTAAQQKADQLQADANALQAQVVAATNIAQALDVDANNKTKEADLVQNYANALDKAVKTNDPKALSDAQRMENELQANSDARSSTQETANNLSTQADAKHKELDKAKTESQDLRDEIKVYEDRLAQLQADLAKEKDPDARVQIQEQIDGVKEDIADDNKQLAKSDANVQRLQNESNDLDNQLMAARNSIAQSKNSSVPPEKLDAQDKTALNNDVVAYQQTVSVSGDPKNYTSVVSNDQQIANNDQQNNQQTANNDQQSNQQTSSVQDINDQYTNELGQTDGISDKAKRDAEQARIYTEWANALDDQIKAKQQELAATNDKNKKSDLKKEIAQLQQQSKDKHKLAADAQKSADAAIASNNQQNNQQQTDVAVQNFNDQLTAAENTADVRERENAKQKVYQDWADTLNARADRKNAELITTKDKKKQQQIRTEIEQLRTEAQQKQDLADQARQNADAVVANNDQSNSANASSDAQNNQQTNQQVNQQSNNIVYNNSAANEAIKNKDQLTQQAAVYSAQRDSLTQLSNNAEGSRKTDLLSQASDAQRKAWQKEAEASSKQGDANNAQFNANADRLKEYQNGSQGNTDPNVSTAELLNDEADRLMKEAANERQLASQAEDPYNRNLHQQAAEDKERQALAKQQEAMARYEQAGVKPLIVSNDQQNNQQTNQQTANNDQQNNQQTNQQTANNDQQNNQQTNQQTANNDQQNNQQTANNDQQNYQNAQRVIDPQTNQQLSNAAVDSARNNEAYDAVVEAVRADNEVQRLKDRANYYQYLANQNVTQAQDLALQAANETDPQKKKDLLKQSNDANANAKRDIAQRDSLNQAADIAAMQAKRKEDAANDAMQNLDSRTAYNVNLVANADNHYVNMQNYQQTANNDQQTNQQTANNDQSNSANASSDAQNNQQTNQQTANNDQQNNQQTNSGSVVNRLQPGEELRLNTNVAATVVADPQLPEGVIYKVQIGAFRNPIPTDLFRNIQPVTSERTSSGLTRYTAGKFKDFRNADAAKNEIRAMGYKDAFVVAYCNGRRVSVAESFNCGGSNVANNNQSNSANASSDAQNNQQANQQTNQQTANTDQQSNQQSNASNIASATDVSQTKGLFYTVQVGVYAGYSNDKRLQGLKGLFSSKAPNGNIRYSTGKYNSLQRAVELKRAVVAHGVNDAFVTAYYDGERITIDQAKQLEAQGKTSPTPEVDGGYEDGYSSQSSNQQTSQQNNASNQQSNSNNQQSSQQNNSSNTNNQQSNSNNTNNQQANSSNQQTNQQSNASSQQVIHNSSSSFIPDTGIVYSVQLGAFKGEVPTDIATKILQFASKGVKNYYEDDTQLTYYQVGIYGSKEEAEALRTEVVGKGLGDAFIVVWKNGKKVPMSEVDH